MKKILALILFGALLSQCSEKEYKLSPEILYQRAFSASTDNNQIITVTEEIADITANVLLDEGISNGRTPSGRGLENERLCDPSIDRSYLIDRSHYDTLLYIGTMTIDYGNGENCNDAQHTRAGQIIDDFEYIVNYEKEIFWSYETITFNAYKKDSVLIDGEFLISSRTGSPITVEAKKATVTYPSGKVMKWEGLLEFETTRVNGEAQTNIITGTVTGVTKRHEMFSFVVSSPVTYNYDCDNLRTPVPVKGSVTMIVNQEKSSVNYGNGDCDKLFTLQVGNRQEQLEL